MNSTKEDKFQNLLTDKITTFLVGLTVPFYLVQEGLPRVYFFEIFILFIVLLNLGRIRYLPQWDFVNKSLIYFILSGLGVLISGYARSDNVWNVFNEFLVVILFLISILYCVLVSNNNNLPPLIIGMIFGGIISNTLDSYSYPNLQSFWKYYAGIPIFYLIIVLGLKSFSKIQLISILAAFGIFSLYLDARLLAFFTTAAIIILFVSFFVPSGKFQFFTLLSLVFAGIPAFYFGYRYLGSNQLLSDVANYRFANTSRDFLQLILSARGNLVVYFRYLMESPFWGYNINTSLDFTTISQFEQIKYSEDIALLEVNRFQAHSLILRFWSSGGLIALVSIVAFFLQIIQRGIGIVKDFPWVTIPILLTIVVAFTISPLPAISRLQIGIALSLLLSFDSRQP